MKKIIILMITVCFFVLGVSPCKANQPDTKAKAVLLMDGETGRVLYEVNGYEKMAMASTTKIMTCILALELGEENQVVEVSDYAAGMPKVHLGMRAGEKYYLKDLLYSLMLESHNDTAVAVAEAIGGSVENFAALMNAKAKKLGCLDTNFITPNGLDATVDGKSHETTARDLGIIAAYAIKNKDFLEIVNERSYTFGDLEGKRQFQVKNKNRFLDMMEGAVGIKTGFTAQAGYCFVGALKRQDRSLISVVLGCGWPPNKGWKWADTKSLMQYGVDNFYRKDIISNERLNPIQVDNGVEQRVDIYEEKAHMSLLLSKEDKIRSEYHYPKKLIAPFERNQMIGVKQYYVNDKLVAETKIRTKGEGICWDYKYCLKKILLKIK